MPLPTPVLKDTNQLLIAIESEIGTEEDFGTAGDPDALVLGASNIQRTARRGEYNREIERGTLTPQQPLIGSRQLDVSADVEWAGKPTDNPTVHRVIRSMAFLRTGVKHVTHGSVTGGGFERGQVIGDHATQGSASATGVVVHVEDGELWYVPTGDAFSNTDTVYNYESIPSSATLSSDPADAGYRFTPMSERTGQTPPSASVENRVGGKRYTIAGARASGSLSFNVDQPLKLSVQWTGAFIVDATTLGPRDGSYVTPPGPAPVPDVIKGVPFSMTLANDSTVSPVMEGAEISFNQTASARKTIGTSIGDSGYLDTRITDRSFQLSIDPESDPTNFEVLGIANRAETIAMLMRFGALDGANGMTIVEAPALSATGDVTPGEREKILTENLTLLLTGSDDDELIIDHICNPAA